MSQKLVLNLLAAFVCLALNLQAALAKDNATAGKGASTETAYFAEGCFWKTQHVFAKLPGVVSTRVGYSGGKTDKPTYEKVCSHTTGHAETCRVEFNPAKISYERLLDVFWSSHDPTTLNRQGPDVGDQYRSAIFYTSEKQKQEALEFKRKLEASHKYPAPIVTLIEPAGHFYDAEDYHQNYYEKHGNVCF